MEITVNVKDIKKGDVFNPEGSGWIATADAQVIEQPGSADVLLDVQFMPDGGFGHRAWPIQQAKKLVVER